MSERLRQLEQTVEELRRILPVAQGILGELLRAAAPVNLEAIENLLRSASQLERHGEVGAIGQLQEQIEAGIQHLRHWLAVADLGISPYVLRTYLERNPLEPAAHKVLIRYFLEKSPHAESDRDKLDYLLTSYAIVIRDAEVFPRFDRPAELTQALAELFPRPVRAQPEPATEMMLHELESLIARVGDFPDFDQLVGARMVERARALKINLGESFYHPQVLTSVIRFNVTFRRHFENLFRQQIEESKRGTRGLIEATRQIFPAIQAAFQKLPVPAGPPAGAVAAATGVEGPAEARMGRPLEVGGERAPIDQLVRRAQDAQKEVELRGIIKRLGRHLSGLTAEQAAAGRITFPLRHTSVELYEWERQAFAPAAESQALISVSTVQFSVGLITWMEEEHFLYEKNRDDRYLWKPHFDLLSYAVERTHDQMRAIHQILQTGEPAEVAAWSAVLVNTAQRLLSTVEKIAPLFA